MTGLEAAALAALGVGGAALLAQKSKSAGTLAQEGVDVFSIGTENYVPAPHAFRDGVAAFIVREGRFVRGLDMNRVPPHWGIDIGAPIGTPVYCAKDGRVLSTRAISGYGNCILVTHTDQSTLYAHLDQSIVVPGMMLSGGDLIGLVGRTSAGPDGVIPDWGHRMSSHLHFEAHNHPEPNLGDYAQRLDPIRWLRNNGIEQYGRRY